MKPSLSIIIVTWKAAETAARCLTSIRRAGREDALIADAEVIVVDNASGDGTAEFLAREFPEARVIVRPTNGGFGTGVNEGLRWATADRILVLNPDCELTGKVASPAAIAELARHLDRNPEVAAVGPSIVDAAGAPAPNGRVFPRPLSELRRQLGPRWPRRWRQQEHWGRRRGVDWISGACMMIRRSALEQVGTFDERFFLYWEETDWCRRARDLGWEINHRPDVRVVHIGGVSASESGATSEHGCLPEHFRRSRRLYFRKHHGAMAALVVEGIHRLRRLRNRWRHAALPVALQEVV